MNLPNTYDIILMLLYENNSQFSGKTNIHKNLFLLKSMMEKADIKFPFDFIPYMYGPYSQEISSGLDMLEDFGLVECEKHIFPGNEIEMRRSVYKLSDSGKKSIGKKIDEFPVFYNLFKENFNKLKLTKSHENTKVMATAAKVKLILNEQNRKMTIDNIKSEAKTLGWNLNRKDMNYAIEILKEAGLVKVISKKE